MARLEQVTVNGEALELDSGLEGRIASTIERSGANSCVMVQVAVQQKSYSFWFPSGCSGGSSRGGGGSPPPEVVRLSEIYREALEDIERNAAVIREAVIGFIKAVVG